jgi:HNH endonuclease
MPVTLVCKVCPNTFQVDPYRKDTALYCSNACRGKGLIKPEETALCAGCGTPFVVKRGARFCSTPCRHRSQSAINMGKSLPSFWSRVQQCGHEWLCPFCCWPFLGTLKEEGYGTLVVHKRRVYAHRVAWEHWNGRLVPVGLVIAHWCHNPACCNPMHLRPATQAVNVEDSIRDGRNAFGERQGHSKFTDSTAMDALKLYASGWPLQRIADHFDVTFATAQSLCLGETWKHLPRPQPEQLTLTG